MLFKLLICAILQLPFTVTANAQTFLPALQENFSVPVHASAGHFIEWWDNDLGLMTALKTTIVVADVDDGKRAGWDPQFRVLLGDHMVLGATGFERVAELLFYSIR
jgi:hypothetical protein